MKAHSALGHGKNGPGVRAFRFTPSSITPRAFLVVRRRVKRVYFPAHRTDTHYMRLSAYRQRCADNASTAPVWRLIIAG